MAVPKWLVVAKNDYRTRTSSIRQIRPYFPYLTVGLLAVYVLFIAPAIVSLFIDDFLAFIISQVAAAMVQIILFMIFLIFIVIPLTYTLREVQTGQLEILLAAPIKPSDVLLGEFMGTMSFYAIAVTVIAGLFTAALTPLGLDMVQMAIIIVVFIVTFLSAMWIGTVITALLRTRLGRTARGKDIGRALSMVLALPLVAVMYAIMGGGVLQALADPKAGGMLKAFLDLLPSSWGADVIVAFARNPGNIAAVWFETLTWLGGLLAFFATVLWMGAKAADRAYSMETTSFTASRAKPDGAFYNTVKYLGGGGSFGTLLVSVFKDYGRRLDNLSRIAYAVGLIALINIFLMGGPSDPEEALFPIHFMAPLLAVFVVGEVTLRGKESLFIYKKTPSGVGRLVRARLVQGWLVVVPTMAAIAAISTSLSPQITSTSLLTNIGLVMLTAAAYVVFALGVSLLNPAFSIKSGNFMLNVMIVAQVSVMMFVGLLIAFGKTWGWLYVPLLQATLCWLLGIVFLFVGKRKLSRIE